MKLKHKIWWGPVGVVNGNSQDGKNKSVESHVHGDARSSKLSEINRQISFCDEKEKFKLSTSFFLE